VIIDEEHRFGVEQRETFFKLKKKPHFFLLSDLGGRVPSAAQPHQMLEMAGAKDFASFRAVEPVHFADRFDEAFARLDRDRGGHRGARQPGIFRHHGERPDRTAALRPGIRSR
jgi:hypothetical protein